MRWVDAATGYDLAPESVTIAAPGQSALELRPGTGRGRALTGPVGRREVQVTAAGYLPMSGWVDLQPGARPAVFLLEPMAPPDDLRPERIAGLWRSEATVFLGFLADAETGGPLEGVRVVSAPAGVATTSDARGYFQLHVPVQSAGAKAASPARLRFEKPGYGTHERTHLELWGNGDWVYRLRLERGGGRVTVDERETRRWTTHPRAAGVPARGSPDAAAVGEPEPSARFLPAATTGSNATVRIPTTIRVLHSGTVYYETMDGYTRHVLPNEWISSWGAYTGGSNSLNAGAVAARTYAIGYVHSPLAGDYDICATTSCQVYNPLSGSTRTDTAVAFTSGQVMVNSSLAIPRGLTEYSAENNQLGMACGDGFTAPTGGCLSDPVCAGEAEFGHGRGMCQWGSARWATGLKFPGGSTADNTSTNGAPRQSWDWILAHYYPTLRLVRGTPLVVGDDVRVSGVSTLTVRACAGGTITNGVNCPSLGTKASGTAGVIVGGPVTVTADGQGYTWWQVQWSDGLTGWSVENYLQRIIPLPPAPAGLAATAVAPDRVDLSWSDASDLEQGFRIEQAPGAAGPWSLAIELPANATFHTVTGLAQLRTHYFRARAFNVGGESANSPVATATTPGAGPVLAPIPDQIVNEGELLALTASATAPANAALLTNFEESAAGTPNGSVLFREPRFSGSTSGLLEPAPNLSSVVSNPPPGNASARVLRVNWSFTNVASPWLRLTTSGATTLGNPVIDFTRPFRFDLHTDRPLRVALGLRETTNAPGTPIGANGGSLGAIEWAGVTNVAGGQPQPSRTVPAGAWTRVEFDPANEPIRSFSGGNGSLFTASGLGVLEHLVLVPADGPGAYNVHLDNFEVFEEPVLTYSLLAGAPTNAAIHPATGQFTWTPSEAQGPATNLITVMVADNSVPPRTHQRSFQVVIREVNRAPVPAPIPAFAVHAGNVVQFTNAAVDPDLPANGFTWSLLAPLPAGAVLSPSTGRFLWTPGDALAGTTVPVHVRVTDQGIPPLTADQSIAITIRPKPQAMVTVGPGNVAEIRWGAIPGRRYQVQTKTTLDEPAWQDLNGPVTAVTDPALFLDPTPGAHRFYRVRALD